MHAGRRAVAVSSITQIAAAKSPRSATPNVSPRLASSRRSTVSAAGDIEWRGKTWRSLSEVARAITGTRWSGPRFFGLRDKADAA